MKTRHQILESKCPVFGPLFLDKSNAAQMDMFTSILEAMKEYAEHAVNEQRELMAKHLNMRNVPRPNI